MTEVIAYTGLSEENRQVLDGAMGQISSRITVERLSDKIPAIGQIRDLNTELLRILHHTYVLLVQRNELRLVVDEDRKNRYGQTEDEALEEINGLLNNIAGNVARWM